MRNSSIETFTYQVDAVRVTKVPNSEVSVSRAGCSPYLDIDEVSYDHNNAFTFRKVFNHMENARSTPVKRYDCDIDEGFTLDVNKFGIYVVGDVILSLKSEDFTIFDICFNTTFIEENYLIFEKPAIDAARQDFHCLAFHRNFKVEIFLHRVRSKLT